VDALGRRKRGFLGWLQERGYGLHDFLILLDSRNRAHRFRDQGLINQPGMKAQTETTKKLLGLYLDQADGDKVKLRQSPNDPFDFTKVKKELLSSLPKNHPGAPFTPGPDSGYEQAVSQLPDDGVSPSILWLSVWSNWTETFSQPGLFRWNNGSEGSARLLGRACDEQQRCILHGS